MSAAEAVPLFKDLDHFNVDLHIQAGKFLHATVHLGGAAPDLWATASAADPTRIGCFDSRKIRVMDFLMLL